MFDPHFRQSSVKGTDLSVADEFVCKLGSVVCLHRLYFESECFYKHLQELYAILRCMFFKCIDKAITSTFVYCRPLIQVLSVAPYCSSETIVRHFFDIYLYLFPRYQYFGIATILSPGSPLFLGATEHHSLRCVYHPTETSGISLFAQCVEDSVPAVTVVMSFKTDPDLPFFCFGMPFRMIVRSV